MRTLRKWADDPYMAHVKWATLSGDDRNQLLYYMQAAFDARFVRKFKQYAQRKGYQPPVARVTNEIPMPQQVDDRIDPAARKLRDLGYARLPHVAFWWVHPSGEHLLPVASQTGSRAPMTHVMGEKVSPDPTLQHPAGGIVQEMLELELRTHPLAETESRVANFERNPYNERLRDRILQEINERTDRLSNMCGPDLEEYARRVDDVADYRKQCGRVDAEKQHNNQLLQRVSCFGVMPRC